MAPRNRQDVAEAHELRMGYLIERQRVLRVRDVVAVLRIRQRRLHSRVICADNSLYQTLTRPTTLIRYLEQASQGLAHVGARGPRVETP